MNRNRTAFLSAFLMILAALPAIAAPAATAPAAPRASYTRNVAIVVYENAEPLDWAGPYEVYHDAAGFGAAHGEPAFNVYIVSETRAPLNLQGLMVTPTYGIADAPKPDIVLYPGGPSNKIYDDPEFFGWADKASKGAEIAQSVCTGAFVLGKSGLLDGFEVTTFHGAIESLQQSYPKAAVRAGRRFVDNGRVVTTAGISAGIDGSLHVVARLLGRRIADQVANYMEYAWSPEATLATQYAYLNPSTDDRGRLAQTAEVNAESGNLPEAEATLRTLLKQDAKDFDTWQTLGDVLRRRNDHAGAGEAFAKSASGRTGGHAGYLYYQAAVEYAKADRLDDAAGVLNQAFEAGYPRKDAVQTDPDLARLKNHPRLKPATASAAR
ncbi:MAG TPA: DJ-1/PfpI family protein [Dongiaceae bacterium]|nr:DJ-1/PfpI family protein [Dongiaceae bacterium]